VITDPVKRRKFDVGSPLMAAAVALDDPELTYGLPPAITAATGMDALTHAVEALVTKNAAPHTDALALEAIRLAGASIRKAFAEPRDALARRMMLMASATAGLAFSNSGLGAVHGLTAPVGGHLGVPHGQANAALLPYVMEYNLAAREGRYAAVARALEPGLDLPDAAAARKAVELVRSMLDDLGIPTLARMGVTEELAPMLARDAVAPGSNCSANPVPVTEEDALAILRRAIGG
jgi:alcohol dehydrogenase